MADEIAETLRRIYSDAREGASTPEKAAAGLKAVYAAGVRAGSATIHNASCEGDWGSEGRESPCRCGERPTSIMRGIVSDGRFEPASDWEQL